MNLFFLLEAGKTEQPISFYGSNPIDEKTLIGMGVVVLLIAIVIVVFMKRARRDDWKLSGGATGNEEIFTRLCEANRLSGSEATLLRRMVYDLNLANPLQVFVEPAAFDRYGPTLGGGRQAAVMKIKGKLFS